MYRVLVVDDVAALRQHAKAVVKEVSPDTEVIEAQTGAQGLQIFRTQKLDMIILDIVMPEMNGIKAAQEIWSENPAAKILFWSQFQRESYVRELGKIVPDQAIHGYALKTESDSKLAEAVRLVLLLDQPYIDPIIRNVQRTIKIGTQSVSDSEYEILLDLLLGLTDKAIAMRQHISVRGAQNKIFSVSNKLLGGVDQHLSESAGLDIYNTRVRIVLEAFRRGMIDVDDINRLDLELDSWLAHKFKFSKTNPDSK